MQIKISVRNLVEFVMRSGDIDDSYVSQDRMVQGIRAHQKLQEEYKDNYKAEYKLTNTSEYGGMNFKVEGRADGILFEDDLVIVDEIKSTTRDLDSLEDKSIHWAQAMCYAYFYSCNNSLEKIGVQLSYYNIEDEQTKRFRKILTFQELKDFYENLLLSYLDFSEKLARYREERNKSIKTLDFPFAFRKGQREMAAAVYKAIDDRVNLFCEAPTGIGKTMSCIFPSIKSMDGGKLDKIFYLTARSTTKDQANSALKILKEKGLSIKSVVITAKEKACLNDKVKCNPRDCPYAKGHFDRVNEGIIDILENEDLIDYETIIKYSEKHRLCPFEFQLDLSIYTDMVICDYNYAFDPSVYLRRFFDSPMEKYTFLVDEAHNLIDRGREMYSAELRAADFLNILESFSGEYLGIRKLISKFLSKIESFRPQMKEGTLVLKEEDEDITNLSKAIMSRLDPFLAKEKTNENYDEILQLYFLMNAYVRISDLYDEGYRTIFTLDKEEMIVVKLLCIDTSEKFKAALKAARSGIFFSATLTPMDFYKKLLGGTDKDYKYHLDSPFTQENLFLGALAISTKYKHRLASVYPICQAISDVVLEKKGNYLVFFPSYAYMEMVYNEFVKLFPDLPISLQKRGMSEGDRENFVKDFEGDSSLVGFAVLGGVFSEGIDLPGDSLIGSIIVSVGLPGLSFERNVIRDFFNEEDYKGFEYAYQYPAMNKILQAAGRVIRTEEDMGTVVLIDDRYMDKAYRRLMPKHWNHIRNYYETQSLKDDIEKFWELRWKNVKKI